MKLWSLGRDDGRVMLTLCGILLKTYIMKNKSNQAKNLNLIVVHQDGELNGSLYASEKLGMAVWKLATGIGGIKERLADAFIELAILKEADFPSERQNQFKQIRLDLTGGKMQFDTRIKNGQLDKVPVGRLYSTLRYMRKEKAQ